MFAVWLLGFPPLPALLAVLPPGFPLVLGGFGTNGTTREDEGQRTDAELMPTVTVPPPPRSRRSSAPPVHPAGSS